MDRKILVCIFFLLANATLLHAQKTINTFTLSPEFNGNPGSSRIAWNELDSSWAIAWHQNGATSSIVARVMTTRGSLGSVKVLAATIQPAASSFDFQFNAHTAKYVLAFESPQGLEVQFFNRQLQREGLPILIESGAIQSMARLVCDDSGQRINIFWFSSHGGTARKTFRSRVLDKSGQTIFATRTLRIAAPGKFYQALDVSPVKNTGNLFVILTEVLGNGNASIIGLSVKPEGTLVRNTPIVFEKSISDVGAAGNAAFSPSGTGVALWDKPGSIQFRKLSPAGTFASPARVIFQSTGTSNIQTNVLFDPAHNRFIGVWTHGDQVSALALNSSAMAVAIPHFMIARSLLGNATNPEISLESKKGNALIVWQDHGSNVSGISTIRVRAALFFVTEAEKKLQGTVVFQKIYTPPLTVRGIKYLVKYHVVTANGKVWKVYVTPETEFIGRKPQEGDFVEMLLEPGRNPFRGYLEYIKVLPGS